MSKRLLLESELPEELNLTPRQVRRLIEDGKLPVVKLTGRTGEVRVRRADLDDYIESCRVPARIGPLAGK